MLKENDRKMYKDFIKELKYSIDSLKKEKVLYPDYSKKPLISVKNYKKVKFDKNDCRRVKRLLHEYYYTFHNINNELKTLCDLAVEKELKKHTIKN